MASAILARPAAAIHAAVVLLLGVLVARPAVAETLELAYQVSWGHITLAQASVSHTVLGERYVLTGSGRTEGFFGVLFDWEGAARTEGMALNGEPRPLRHSHAGTLNGNKRQTHVTWRPDGAPVTWSDPPPDEEKVTPVPAGTTAGTADPFTVLLNVLESLNAKGRCEAKARIWDGRRRYDLVVEDLGQEILAADRPWAYAGPSVKCGLRVERIGGFWRETASWKREDDTGERTVWAADIGGGRFVPVRAELETAFGTVVGRLEPVEGARKEARRAEP